MYSSGSPVSYPQPTTGYQQQHHQPSQHGTINYEPAMPAAVLAANHYSAYHHQLRIIGFHLINEQNVLLFFCLLVKRTILTARHRIIYTRHHRSVRQSNYVQIVIQSQMGIAGGGRGDRVHQIRYTWMMNTTDELRRLQSCAATLERPSTI